MGRPGPRVLAVCLSVDLVQPEMPYLRHAGESGRGVRDGGDAGEQLLVIVPSQVDKAALVLVAPHHENVPCVERLDCRLDLGVGGVVAEALSDDAAFLGLVAPAKANEIAVVDAKAVGAVGEEAPVHRVVDDEVPLGDGGLSFELVEEEPLADVQRLRVGVGELYLLTEVAVGGVEALGPGVGGLPKVLVPFRVRVLVVQAGQVELGHEVDREEEARRHEGYPRGMRLRVAGPVVGAHGPHDVLVCPRRAEHGKGDRGDGGDGGEAHGVGVPEAGEGLLELALLRGGCQEDDAGQDVRGDEPALAAHMQRAHGASDHQRAEDELGSSLVVEAQVVAEREDVDEPLEQGGEHGPDVGHRVPEDGEVVAEEPEASAYRDEGSGEAELARRVPAPLVTGVADAGNTVRHQEDDAGEDRVGVAEREAHDGHEEDGERPRADGRGGAVGEEVHEEGRGTGHEGEARHVGVDGAKCQEVPRERDEGERDERTGDLCRPRLSKENSDEREHGEREGEACEDVHGDVDDQRHGAARGLDRESAERVPGGGVEAPVPERVYRLVRG